MNISYTINTVFEIVDSDLETLVEEVYGLSNYSFATIQQCGDGSYHRFLVDGELSEEDEMDIEIIQNEGRVPTGKNDVLLNLMYNDGHIEAGIYFINAWL